MTGFFQTGADRAARRGANVVLFRPPSAGTIDVRQWHWIDTHLGRKRLRWNPGIEVWTGEDHERWTAEFAGESGWKWVGIAENQFTPKGRRPRQL